MRIPEIPIIRYPFKELKLPRIGQRTTRDALRRLSFAERLAALEATVPHAGGAEAGFVFDELVELLPSERGRLGGGGRGVGGRVCVLLALLGPRLDAERQRTLGVLANGRWDELTPGLLARGRSGRVALAGLLAQHVPAGMTKRLADLYRHADRAQSDAADRALYAYAARVIGAEPEQLAGVLPACAGGGAIEPDHLVRAVAEAAWMFGEHHRARGPLMVSLLMVATGQARGPNGARLRRLLAAREHPAATPLATLLRTSAVPVLRSAAWRWLGDGMLARSSLDRVATAESVAEHAALARVAHLGLRPRRGLRARLIDVRATSDGGRLVPGAALPTGEAYAALSTTERRGALRLARMMRVAPEAAGVMHGAWLADPEAGCRLAAAGGASAGELDDWLFDADPAVARSAALRWSLAGLGALHEARPSDGKRRRLCARAARGPHAPVARVALDEAGAMDPWADTPTSRLRARRWALANPSGFVRAVHQRVRTGSAGERLAAIRLVDALGMAARFEHELGMVIEAGADTRSVASAVGAMAVVPGARAGGFVRLALSSGDARVRANAVEALARRARAGVEPDLGSLVLAASDDVAPRVRANALHESIRGRGVEGRRAVGGLDAMLREEKASARLSGAWVAERVLPVLAGGDQYLWASVADRIVELAERDEDERVRARAGRAVRRLLGTLRGGANEEAVAGVIA